MTKLIVESDNNWAKRKIKDAILSETELLRKALNRTEQKVKDFEEKYGTAHPQQLYGKADDLVLIEWEGEIETVKRLRGKLAALEEIIFEYK